MSYGFNYQEMFLREQGAECLLEMHEAPKAIRLFGEFIRQGDFAVLCGPEGAGKSILGLQIADSLSRGKPIGNFEMDCGPQKVVYLDFENKGDEFISRYSLNGKNPHPFHKNFARVRFHPRFFDFTKMRKDLIRELHLKVWHETTVLVVNSLDYLKCFVSESFILGMLKQLKEKTNLTVLLIAGTRGSKPGQKMGADLLSHPVRGMADSIFAVGHSQRGENIRYIKQLKRSMGAPVYNKKRVAEFTIGKPGNFTGFWFTGFGKEFPHVVEPPTEVEAEIIQLRLSNPALTFAEIASQLSTYKMKVKRVLDKYAEIPGLESRDAKKPVDREVWNKILGSITGSPTPSPESEEALPSNPFRGDVEPTIHPSDLGVKQSQTLDTLVTPVTGITEKTSIADTAEALPSNPFRGELEPTNHPSGLGVKQPLTFDYLKHLDRTHFNPHPYRDNVLPPEQPCDPATEESETLEESLKTLDALITSYCKDKPAPGTPDTELGKQPLTYGQQLKKQFAERRKRK